MGPRARLSRSLGSARLARSRNGHFLGQASLVQARMALLPIMVDDGFYQGSCLRALCPLAPKDRDAFIKRYEKELKKKEQKEREKNKKEKKEKEQNERGAKEKEKRQKEKEETN